MYSYQLKKHELKFIKPAKTSRNVFKTRLIYIIYLTDLKTKKTGIGEAAPLHLLSTDDVPNYEEKLNSFLGEFCINGDLEELELHSYPSIKFGIETALLDLNAKDGALFQTPFTKGAESIPVNGLVWMNNAEEMYNEAEAKIKAGFDVIKFKVGALDFDKECRLLEKIRSQYSAFKLTIRLDANGAFLPSEALEQIKELSRFEIHSIEQPIKAQNWDAMQQLCSESKIDIALDEELIGVKIGQDGEKMLQYIKPQYIILKPNLIGGLKNADLWVSLARKHNIDWWATSALESNIGLNAIAQWVSKYPISMAQGLGTGALFTNNFATSLKLEKGKMWFRK
ncbi:MAG: hypothetical protein RLZZ337_2046 [Bacteroidota bacterium]|jgi:o-succinylbenzoate synthase